MTLEEAKKKLAELIESKRIFDEDVSLHDLCNRDEQNIQNMVAIGFEIQRAGLQKFIVEKQIESHQHPQPSES